MSGQGRRVPPTARLAEFPETAAGQAQWWEKHILEVLHGLPPDAPEGAVPRPEFDPKRLSLAQRERAKAAELTAAGHAVTASGIKQRRQRYQRDGLVGLADGRSAKQMPAFGQVDPAVVEAMRQAIAETADASSRTIGFVVWRTKQILAGRQDVVVVEVPSERTLYRLFDKLAVGTHSTGSARTRRSVALRPSGPFGEVPASAPGELMQIDSTPLDVLVRLDDGIAEKVELTAMVDIATRSITAAVLRPTTKAADASALLARSVTPETMRPGWPEALRMSRSVLPHRRLLSMDERLEHAAARPVIVPETIVCDHGKVFISNNFRASCRYLGINLQPAHKATPTDRARSRRHWAQSPHCSLNSLLVTPADRRTAEAGSWRTGRCGHCPNSRTFLTSGSSPSGKPGHTTRYVTRMHRNKRSRRTRSTRRSCSPAATSPSP
ncbi:hypothetical protein [Streptomyces mirabilis]|uniref:hypothetical protein n=1 Tax=Streptomyces mirabilis TaxID=68239 RepID=UPI003D9EF430